MNYWICQKCNTQNTSKFCMNCGAAANEQTASDLPPTVFGFQPSFTPNQFQPKNQPQQQSQPNFMPQPSFQPSPSLADAPKKSKLLKFLLIGGIVGLIVIGSGSFLLYSKVVEPYLYEREIADKEREKESRAKSKTVIELLPETITHNSQTVNRGRTIHKSLLLESIEKKMPPLASDSNNIDDAIAGGYFTADNREAGMQIFKFNSTEQAKNACKRISQEMTKNKNNFVREPFIVIVDNFEGTCGASGDSKTGQSVSVASSYRFLYVTSGDKDYVNELVAEFRRRLNS